MWKLFKKGGCDMVERISLGLSAEGEAIFQSIARRGTRVSWAGYQEWPRPGMCLDRESWACCDCELASSLAGDSDPKEGARHGLAGHSTISVAHDVGAEDRGPGADSRNNRGAGSHRTVSPAPLDTAERSRLTWPAWELHACKRLQRKCSELQRRLKLAALVQRAHGRPPPQGMPWTTPRRRWGGLEGACGAAGVLAVLEPAHVSFVNRSHYDRIVDLAATKL